MHKNQFLLENKKNLNLKTNNKKIKINLMDS